MTAPYVSHKANGIDTATTCTLTLDGVTLPLGRMTCLFVVRDLSAALVEHREHGAKISLSLETIDGTRVDMDIDAHACRNLIRDLAGFV